MMHKIYIAQYYNYKKFIYLLPWLTPNVLEFLMLCQAQKLKRGLMICGSQSTQEQK